MTDCISSEPSASASARPRLVILDAITTTQPGSLRWAPLEALGDCTFHDRTDPADTADRIREADAVFLNKAKLTAEAIAAAPRLRYIGILATGYNTLDLDAAHRRGILVSNVPGYSTMSVAQQAMALLLEVTNQVGVHSTDAFSGGWSRHPDYCRALTPLLELDGHTMGIIGLGAIGTEVARIAQALGMRVLAVRRRPGRPMPAGVEECPLPRLLAESDVVSLHCPLTDQTRHLINAQTLALMKPSAILLNTSRGPLLDEAAVAAALHNGMLGALAVDVLSVEPPPADHPFLHAPRCIITPHIAWATAAARRRLIDQAADNYRAFLDGTPKNSV